MPDPINVLVPQDGSYVYLADVGSTIPADIETAVPTPPWQNIGYISEDGPSLNPAERETSEIRDWVGALVKIVNTTVTRSVTLPLLETTRESLRLAFDGGTFTATANGVKFVPGGDVQERAIIIHMVEGDSLARFAFKRAIVSEVAEVTPSAETGTVWEITFTNGDPGDDTDGFEFHSNLPGVISSDWISA